MSNSKDKLHLTIKKSTLKKDDVFERDPEAPLGFRIKRIKAEQIEHKSKLLINGSNRILIVGGSGRGKSTLVLELLPMFSDKTTHILVCSVKQNDDAFTAIEKYCEFSNIKYLKVDNEIDTAGAIEEIVHNKKETDHYIVIFDDLATAYSSSIKDPTNSVIATAYSLLRSSNGSLIMVTQSYNNINTKIRLNSNLKFAFAQDDVYSTRAIIEDTVGMFFSGSDAKQIRNDIKGIFRSLYDDFHQWILISSNPPSIRKKWTEIIYPPELVHKGEGGVIDLPVKKPVPKGLAQRRELLKQAIGEGFPPYAHHSPAHVIKEYLNEKEKNPKGNFNAIVAKSFDPDPKRSRTQLMNLIKSYRLKKSPLTLCKITECCERMVENGLMPEDQLKYLLKEHGFDQYLDFVAEPEMA